MTLIEMPQEDKRCFVACSEDKRKQGYCSCYNKMVNKQLRQYNVVRQSEQLFCTMAGKGFCPYENKDGSCNMTDGNCLNHIKESAK